MRVLIVVASRTGRTRRLADALAAGVREGGGETRICEPERTTEEDLCDADAIALGSGVHMGGIASEMRAFFERMSPLWLRGTLVGKLGAAFVTAGDGGRGGAELALLALHANLAEHGALLVSMPHRLDGFREGGSHWGPVAWTNPRDGVAGPTEAHCGAARAYGRHLAQCAARWRAGGEGLDAG